MGATRDLTTGQVRCTACKTDKPLEEFYVTSSGRPGSWCRTCRKEKATEWKRANPEKMRRFRRKWSLKRDFGISEERFLELYGKALADNVCEVCKRPEVNGRHLSVDHDHVTGALRGYICTKCNTVLGFVEDDQQLLYGLIMYLEHYKSAPRGHIAK